jgi:hypothetical protein
MALKTFSLRDMAISPDDIDMALIAGHASCNIFPMIETPAFDLDIPLRFNMARGTTSNRTRNALLLTLRSCLVIVTDKTVDFMNSEVGALNKLSMAGCATKLHFPSQFT